MTTEEEDEGLISPVFSPSCDLPPSCFTPTEDTDTPPRPDLPYEQEMTTEDDIQDTSDESLRGFGRGR